MYNFLLVDDETYVLNGLKKQILSISDEVSNIFTAKNGLEALKIMQTEKIDIIFSDIKMPIMDGIEFIQKARELSTKSKIIILSGYDDFEYAKQVMTNNVNYYILKPVTKTELTETLEKVISQHKKDVDSEYYLENLKHQLHSSLPILKEKFFYELSIGNYNDELAKYINFEHKIGNYKIALISVMKNGNNSDKLLSILNISNKVNSFLDEKLDFSLFSINDNVCVLFNLNTTISNVIIENLLNNLQKEISDKTTFGVSSNFSDIKLFYQHFKQAETALNHKVFSSLYSIVFYDNIATIQNKSTSLDISHLKNSIYNSLNSENIDEFVTILKSLKTKFCKEKIYSNEIMVTTFLDILTLMMIFCFEHSITTELLATNQKKLNEEILFSKNIDEILHTLTMLYSKITSIIKTNYISNTTDSISRIKEYIKTHISDDISLTSLSNVVYLTPNYISAIFKKETGLSFKDYVIHEKIEYAKKMLAKNTMKVYEVANTVGYRSVTYFSKIFKNQTGVYPSDYKPMQYDKEEEC